MGLFGVGEMERRRRKIAIIMVGIMIITFIVLSAVSFVDARGNPDPDKVTFNGETATEGKRVFQQYGGMDAHTVLGNGGYFGPDLTNIYAETGPAWLHVFLSTPSLWPSSGAVNASIKSLAQQGLLASDEDTPEEYYEKYPGAWRRAKKRGGTKTIMPPLKFSHEEVDALIAYFKYLSMVKTESWPSTGTVPEAKRTNISDSIRNGSIIGVGFDG